MATDNKSKSGNSNKNNKKRKNYLPHNKPVKKGGYPLRPGVEGFFITCDGGREYQAAQEAINVIESFYEELLEGKESKVGQSELPKKPMNKVIKFADSDSSGSDNDDDNADGNNDVQTKEDTSTDVIAAGGGENNGTGDEIKDDVSVDKQIDEKTETLESNENQETETVEPPVKRQCIQEDARNGGNLPKVADGQSVDKLIEAELAELGDKSKRRFGKLDTGCNGVVFIQMRKKDGDPSPKDIVQHMMSSLASTKKHVSRFLLRVLPVEVSCYTSDEEITRAIKPVIDKYFPVEAQTPHKFAVLYDARANTGVDRTKVIDAVAKSVPSLHKVDLANPDINIVVQVVKTVCLIGVVEKYKELAKYNLRQLTSSDQ
ncbi:hypothetical protein ABFS83_14G220500 [Erythranthe nasuta]